MKVYYLNKTNSALPVLGVPRIVRCDMGTENTTIAFNVMYYIPGTRYTHFFDRTSIVSTMVHQCLIKYRFKFSIM